MRSGLIVTAVLALAGACCPAGPMAPGAVAYDLYTHCGVIAVTYMGERYYADPPNPPGHWSNPFDHGTLASASPGTVVFTDAAANRAVFSAHPKSGIPTIPPCD